MTLIEILGIHGADDTTRLWGNVTTALEELGMCAKVVSVTDVDRFIQYQINSIPALALNGSIVMEKEIPNVEDLKLLIDTYSRRDAERRRDRILVPVDFSNTSRHALAYAMSLAGGTDTEIHVLHVLSPSPVLSDVPALGTVPPDTGKSRGEQADKEMDAMLAAAVADLSLRPDEARLVRHMRTGFPVEEILRYAEEFHIGLVIMGSRRNKKPLERYFGSVSMVVSEKATCPVMLLPPETSFPDVRKLLYAVAGQGVAVEPIRKLLRVHLWPNAEIHFVHVRTDRAEVGTFETLKNELVEQLFSMDQPSFPFIVRVVDAGDVKSGLIGYAREQGIEVVVLLYREHNWFVKLLQGGPVREFLRDLALPVVMLHV